MKKELTYLNELLKQDDKIIVAVSGGPDSMVLLILLCTLRDKYNLKIIVAYVNHNVRKNSVKEAEFVKSYCQVNEIIFETMTIENLNNDNFHHETRKIRYTFFEELIKKYGAQYLMTAHHGDDLIETILMRLVRGSSLSGYAGFKKETQREGYQIIRPLMNVSKEVIMAYIKTNKIKYVVDESNEKNDYTRNRYRHHILPFLKGENEDVHEKFLKFSNLLTEHDEYLKKTIKKDWQKIYYNNTLDLKRYHELEELKQLKTLEMILEQYYQDDLYLINDEHITVIKKLIESTKSNGTIDLPNDFQVVKSYNNLIVMKKEPVLSYNIKLDDAVKIAKLGIIRVVKESELTNNYCTRLDSEEITLPLYVRSRKNGDKIVVKNLAGTKKVNDIFIDMKIPKSKRDLWPIVVDSNDKVVWLPGLKKTKFDKEKQVKYDIILTYFEEVE